MSNIELGKYKIGEKFTAFCCRDCVRKRLLKPKDNDDSGKKSWYCEICCQHNIGSFMICCVPENPFIRIQILKHCQQFTKKD